MTHNRSVVRRLSLLILYSTLESASFVGAQAPVADFSGTPQFGFAPLDVQFTDESTGSTFPFFSWGWSFGDGDTSTSQNPSHRYDDPGAYIVSLGVVNAYGNDTDVRPDFIRVDQVGSHSWSGGWLGYVGNMGPHSSLALNPDGLPAIAYCHGVLGIGSNMVKYAYFDGADWNLEVIDDDTDAGPHISLAFDSTGTAHVAYYDAENEALNYARRDSSGIWQLDRVDNDPDNVGQYPSIAIDANDRPHISYYDADDGDALYAVHNGIAWILTNIEWQDDVGQYSSLVLDSNDMPRVCYYNATDNALQVAVYDDGLGFWLYDTVDDSADVGEYCHMAIADGAIPSICYYDADNGNLKYAIWFPLTTSWQITTVDATGDVGEYCDLALDEDGDPYISYYDRTNGDLKIAAFNRTLRNWSIEVAEDFNDSGQFSGLEVDTNGVIHVCYYDADNDGLLYAGSQASAPEPPTAEFAGWPTNGLAPLTVQFASLASGTVTSRDWFFGDGGTSTDENPSHVYATPGTYTVEYQVENDHGFDSEEKVAYITVQDPTLTAAFTHTPPTGVVSLTVYFTNTSTGPVAGRLWTFGDGGMSTNDTPSHTYAAPGSYTVSLTVTNAQDSDTKTVNNAVTVLEHIDADFTRGPASGVVPLMVTFTNTSTGPYTHSLWSFGDGQTSTLAAPSHTYTNVGAFSVSLTVSNAYEADVVALSNAVTALEGVDAVFTASPVEGVVLLAVQFTNESTGPYTHSLWGFGDGQSSAATSPNHTYTTAGTYTVSLTVSNSYDVDTQVLTDHITVLDHIVPAFSGGPLVAQTPSLVTFTNATTGAVTEWAWSFGDGASSNVLSPSHTYSNAGVYTVALEASNAYETQSLVRTNYVTVLDPPGAAFGATPHRGPRPLTVQFTDQSTGSVSTWLWDFGDGDTSTNQNPSHVYTDVGEFDVTLTVSNAIASDVHTKTDLILTYDETYVSPFGSHTWPFHSWVTAANDIQSAISAQTYGGTVWVSNGTYNAGSRSVYGAMHNRVVLSNRVQVLSVNGPAATVIEGQPRDWEATPEAIRGAHVGDGCLLCGFTLSSGGTLQSGDEVREQSGGGAWCEPEGVVSNCMIAGNTAEAYGGGVYGGRVYDSELNGNGGSEVKWGGAVARASVYDSQIYCNTGYWGGAVYGGTNLRCTIRENVGVYGGATYESCSLDCRIVDNESYEGGGTWKGRLDNCLVIHNLAKESGGAYGKGGGCYQSDLIHGTVADNEAQVEGGGIYGGSAGNTIIYFNTAGSYGPNYSGGALQYSCTTPAVGGGSNITGDPGFVNRGSRDYHLGTNSPCIDTATYRGITHDLDQFMRPRDGDDNGAATYDMGAYEYWPAAQQLVAAAFSADERQAHTGQSVQFTDESTGPIVSWHWDFGDGGTNGSQNPSHVYATENTYTVSLRVDGATHSDTETKVNYISVRDPIVVDFTGTPRSTDQTSLTVQFTNLTTGLVDGWLWEFGDYMTSTERDPSHHYHTNGSYTVKLTASNVMESVSLTRPDYVNVATSMEADFQADRTNGVAPLTVQFWTDSIGPLMYWSWDFGDGAGAGVANPSHTYTNPGTYTVTHTVSNDYDSSTITKTNLIEVLGPIDAGFAASPTEGFAPLAVQFSDESTGPVTHWSWSFGDGQGSAAPSPLHTYVTPGVYSVTLIASNAFESSVMTKTSEITARERLVAGMSVTPPEGVAPLTVQFTDTSAGPVTDWLWSFGDGATSTAQSPQYTYTNAGPYTVVLSVSNAFGSDRVTNVNGVTVLEPLSAAFSGVPQLGPVPMLVQFTNESTGPYSSSLWDFGDGHAGTIAHPEHTYSNAGLFSVSLVVSNDFDASMVVRTNYIVVQEKLVAAFAASPTEGPAPHAVTFTDQSAGPATAWTWSFGDGATSALRHPSHTFTNVGVYTVSLTVSNATDRATETKTSLITVNQPVVAGFTGSPLTGPAPLSVQFTDASIGPVSGWSWRFGDGATGAGTAPLHVYTNPGTYTVSQTVTNGFDADILVRTDYITVRPPLDTAFTATPLYGSAPLDVLFTNVTVGLGETWLWDFGDGNISSLENPSHTYTSNGSYTVILRASNSEETNTETRVDYIGVSALTADFAGSPTNGLVPVTVAFTNLTEGFVYGWRWDFGDGGESSDEHPVHTYTNAGRFTVSLTATNAWQSNTVVKAEYVTTRSIDARFASGHHVGPAPLTVDFSNDSTGPYTAQLWDFGDGQTSTNANPSHTYAADGDYTVTLTVMVPGQSHATTSVGYVRVGSIVAGFAPVSALGSAPLPVAFFNTCTGPVMAYAWDFGDGGTSTDANPDYAYAAEGTYTVTLRASNALETQTVTRVDAVVVLGQRKSDWLIRTVNASGGGGKYSSLVLTADDRPMISYYGDPDLMLAEYDGTNYVLTTVDSSDNSGLYTSLALDGAGRPAISYHAGYLSDLRYAVFDGATWQTQAIDTAGMVGLHTSLAFDGSDRPMISYVKKAANPQNGNSDDDLYLARYNGAAWATELVDAAGNVGHQCSLALDASGRPAIAYSGGGDVRYAAHTGAAWTRESVAPTSLWQNHTSLALDAGGRPVISYYDRTGTDLKFARSDGALWHVETVDGDGSVGEYTSIALDGSLPRISYYNSLASDLKFAAFDGSDWLVETVDPGGYVGKFTSLALDSRGRPWISYYDEFNDALKLASPQPLAADFASDVTGGSAPLTVQFIDVSGGDVTSRTWDFGDGTTRTDSHPEHTYTSNGVYTVTLTVGDGVDTDLLERVGYINVLDLRAGFTANQASGGSPLTVAFSDDSQGHEILSWAWDFGDGGSSTHQNPTHTYTSNGTYAVTLTVTNRQDEHTIGVPDYIDVVPDGWTRVTIDARGDSGLYASLALDGRTPHIAYYDATNHVARYATYDGSAWLIEDVGDTSGLDGHTTLDLRPDGLPTIVYYGSDGIGSEYFYGVRSGASWQVEASNLGGWGPSSLAHTYLGEAQLALAGSSYGLEFASRAGASSWNVSPVDAGDSARYVSLQLPGGIPTISYYDAAAGNLMYTYFLFGKWQKRTVDASPGVGAHNSLAMHRGWPRISYYDAAQGALKYAWRNNSADDWNLESVDNTGDVGTHTSLQIDERGLPRICYYDEDNQNLKYAAFDGENWTIVTLDDSGSVGRWCSLVLDPLGNPAVAYYDADAKALRYMAAQFDPFGFSGTPRTGAPPLDVTFTSRSTVPAKNWHWDFGDDQTSTNEHPQHTYNALGRYTVVLTADVGGTPTAKTNVEYIVVNDLSAGFAAGPVGGVTPLTVTFTNQSSGTIDGQRWDFGDGTVGTNVHPTHIYSNSGVYTVTLTVSNTAGAVFSTRPDYIEAAGPLNPAFAATPPAGVAPVDVQFTDETSGVPSTWVWDFGDGQTSTNQHPLHTYTTGGVYSVSLTVENTYENVSTTRVDVITVEDVLTVDFVADKTTGVLPLRIAFTSQVTGDPEYYVWQFGDGRTSTEPHPVYTYTTPGNYTVQLRVTSPLQADSVMKMQYIEVQSMAADFSASPQVGSPPLFVGFSDLSVGPVESWQWDFGDGSTSGLRNAAHTYTEYGHYAVSLTVTGDGKTDTMTKTECIRVEDLEARFAAAPRIGSAPLQVAFTNESTGDVQTRLWEFGDGITSTDANPVHTYTQDGDYTVTLSVYDSFDTHTFVRTNYVRVGDLNMNWTLWDLGDSAQRSTSLVVDSRDRAHIAYATHRNGGDVRHLVVEGVSWTVRTVDTNTDYLCSLALDAASRPHVAYVRREDGDSTNVLCYAVLDGSNWVSDVIYDTVRVLGVKLALGGGDRPWLAFHAWRQPLQIASMDQGAWQVSSVDLSADTRPALAIQPTGYPAVATAFSPVKYAAYDGAAWQVEQSYLVGGYTAGSSLAFGDDGVPLIASLRGGGQSYYGLRLVRLGEPDWSSEVIDPDPDAGWYCAMAVGPYGNVGVAYMTASNQLKFAVQHGTGWHIETLDEGVDPYYLNAGLLGLDFDSRGCAHISYCCNGRLKYAFNSDVVQARFSASPTSGEAPLAVQFTDQSAGAVASRLWYFGDGQTSAEVSPLHTYTADGVYTVSLTVGDGENTNTMTRTNLVSVESFAASFSASPTEGGPGLVVQFTNASTGTVDSFAWDFGDGGTSTDENPAYVYTNAGLYDVSLTVSNAWRTQTLTRDNLIRVHTVYADFSSGVTTGMPPLTVAFTNLSMGHTNAVWSFGDVVGDYDPVESMATNVEHTYRFIGTYKVQLRVDGGGETDWAVSNDLVVVSNPEWDLESVLTRQGEFEQGDVRLAQDADGRELIAYHDNGTLWLATHDGGNWTTEQVASGVTPGHDLAVTDDGIPVLSYQDASPNQIVYAYKTNGAWTAVTVANNSAHRTTPSIALDAAGTPWIAFHALDGVRVADYRFDGTNWQWHTELVDRGAQAGQSARIDVSRSGKVGVTYCHNGAIRYAIRTFINGAWQWMVSTVDSNAGFGAYGSLRFDDSGTPHLAYWNKVDDDLKYGVFNGSSWAISTIDREGEVGRYCDLTLDASGYPRIAYAIQHDHHWFDRADDDLKFAWYTGSEWHTEQIDGASYCQRVGTRVLDDGRPAIAYLSPTDVRYAVCNRPVDLTANFVASPRGGRSPLSVTFEDKSYGNPVLWEWDFDGTNKSTVPSPTHVYPQPGKYTVRCTVKDEDGDEATTVVTNCIVVEDVTAGFVAGPTVGMVPLDVHFTNTSSVLADRWSWNFGDGETSDEESPVHTYASTGTFSVALIASSTWAADTNRQEALITVTNVPPPPPLQVANVRAEQRIGTKLVDIYFDLAYSSNRALHVTIEGSDDGGASFDLPVNEVVGHGYNSPLIPGANRRVEWNAGLDWDGQDQDNVVFRVTVEDGVLTDQADSDQVAINTIVTGPPVVQDVQSIDCNAKKHVYYLNGVSVPVEFWTTIDWNGHTPGEIVWLAADKEYGGRDYERDFDVGTQFGVGGKLSVIAVAADGTESKPVKANFDVIDPPIGIPANLFVALNGKPLRYHVVGHVFNMLDAGLDTIGTDDGGNALPGFSDTAMKLKTRIMMLLTIYGNGTALAQEFTLFENSTEIGNITLEPKVSGAVRLSYQPTTKDWLPTGNMKFELKTKVETPEKHIWPGIYLKGAFDITGGVDFQLVSWTTQYDPVFNGEFPVVAGVEFMAGAGSSYVFAFEAYLRGTGFLTAQYPNKPHLKTLGVGLEGGGRLVSKLGGYEKTLAKISTNWYHTGGPPPKSRGARALAQFADSGGFEPLSRGYADAANHDCFYSLGLRSLRRGVAPDAVPELLVENMYPFADPCLAAASTNRVLLWVHDDTTRLAENRTELLASRWSEPAWATPLPVWDDGTGDFMADVVVLTNGLTLAAWVNGSSVLPTGASFGDSMTNSEIAVAISAPGAAVWTAFNLTTNAVPDHSPRLAVGTNGHALLTWIRNATTNLQGSVAEPNSLHFSRWDGATWAAESQALGGIGMVLWADMAFDGTNGVFVAAIDGDDDGATVEDAELYATAYGGGAWGAWSRLTNDGIEDTSPKVAYDAQGNIVLVWSRDGMLVSSATLDLSAPSPVVEAGAASSAKDLEVITGPDGQITLLWADTPVGGGRPEPLIGHYDASVGLWSEPLPLLDNDALEREMSGAYGDDNHLLLAYGSVEILTNALGDVSFGETDLMVLDYQLGLDPAVCEGGLVSIPEIPRPGEAATLSVEVQNIGELAATAVVVRFFEGDPDDGGVQIGSDQVVATLRAGSITNVSVAWNVPSVGVGPAIYVVVDPDATTADRDRTNNQLDEAFLLPDLAFAGVTVERSAPDRRIAYATVVNAGTVASEAPAQVRFIRGATNGPLLSAVSVSALSTGKQFDASFEWDLSGETFTSAYEYVYVVADRPNAVVELNEENNLAAFQIVTTLDSDGDGLFDGDEERIGTNPLVADSDGDGLSDHAEFVLLRTNPLKADSDGDGMGDGDELTAGTSPLDRSSVLRLGMQWRPDLDAFVLRWPSVSNRVYVLRHGAGLLVPSGTNRTFTARPPENLYTNPAGTRRGGYFQLEVREK